MLLKSLQPFLIKFAATFLFMAIAACAVRAEPGVFSITVVKPAASGISDNNLSVVVAVSSTFELRSVKAEVEGREVNLAFSTSANCDNNGGCGPGWAGLLSLAGLSRGAKVLTITATDIFDATGQVTRQFIYDRPPSVSITNPAPESVTGLSVHVTASCSDDDAAGCKAMSVSWGLPFNGAGTSGTVLQVNQSSIDNDVTLPASVKGITSDGATMILTVAGTDSAGQSRSARRTIYLQHQSRLIEVESFQGRILDIQPERVLLLDDSSGASVLKIRTRSTGQESVLPLTGQVLTAGFLFSHGAIFAAIDSSGTAAHGHVYEWRDGALDDLGEIFTGAESGGLKVKGDYAIWDRFSQSASAPVLLLRNLSSASTAEIAVGANTASAADVAANGDVVYIWAQNSGDTYNIYRYRNGTSSQLTNDAQNYYNTSPITDGTNVVYLRKLRTSQASDYSITLYDAAGSRSELGTTPFPSPMSQYQTAGGWVAFTKTGGGGAQQIWTRSPAGTLTQVSFFGTHSFIKQLASNGELTFVNGVRIYLHREGDPLLNVCADNARLTTFLSGSQWYAFLGRTLFRLPTVPDLAPVLLTEGASGRALALEATAFMRDPFPFSGAQNLSADGRTRVMLLARNVDWMSVNAPLPLTVQAEDAQHHVFPLTVEYAAPDARQPWLAEIIVRLPDALSAGGEVWVTLNVGGLNSNKAKLTITGSRP